MSTKTVWSASRLNTLDIFCATRMHVSCAIFRSICYSSPGESREDFHTRCLELLGDSFRAELDEMREVIQRRLGRIEQNISDPTVREN